MLRKTIALEKVEGPVPLYDHNYLLASAFLSAIRNINPDVSRLIHDSTRTSPYVLSEIHPIKNYKTGYYFCVGTTSKTLSELISDAFSSGTRIKVDATVLRVIDIKAEEVPDSIPSPIELATLSPVLVREEKNHSQCLIPTDSRYLDALNRLVDAKISRFVGERAYCRVLRVVPTAIRRRRIADGFVLATKGKYYLEGDNAALKLILEHGLGANTAMAFGYMVPSGRCF